MFDFIYKLMFLKKVYDVFIVNRNKIMINSIDFIVKIGSLFLVVGVVYFVGNDGMIEFLR